MKAVSKQWGLAVQLYADDYNGYFVPCLYRDIGFVDFLMPYLTTAKTIAIDSNNTPSVIWGCPTYLQNITVNYYGTASGSTFGYGETTEPAFESNLNPDPVLYKLDNITCKSARLLIGDCQDYPLTLYNIDPATSVSAARHSGSANFVFFDYHVKLMKPVNAMMCFTNPPTASGY